MEKNEKAIRGKIGEDAVCAYLTGRGFSVTARNFRVRSGEVDIVAVRDGEVRFVEVKARSGVGYGTPGEAVTAAKRRRIVSAARAYAAANGLYDSVMLFDVAEVYLTDGRERIRYIENAFDMRNI